MIKRLVLIFLALPVVFTVMEIGIRFVIPQPLAPTLYRFHPIYSFFVEPDNKVIAENPDYKISLNINSSGFRGKEFDLNNGNRNVLVLGDSYAFGSGVEDNETFPALLEEKLRNNGAPVNILNTAVPAWGTTQKLLFLQREGKNYDPILVLWEFCETDFLHNLQFGLHEVVNDSLVYFPPSPSSRDRIRRYTNFIPFYGWLVQRSHTVSLVRRIILLAMNKNSLEENEKIAGHNIRTDSSLEKWILLKELTKEMLKTSEEMNIPLLPVFIPSGGREIQKQGYNPVVDSLLNLFDDKKIPYIDFTYLGFSSEMRFASDGHWRPKAHALAADSLFKYITNWYPIEK